MNDLDLFGKTPAGFEEIKGRSQKLAPRLRSMLVMVDGTRTVAQLRDAAQTLGAPPDYLEALLLRGLIVLDRSGVLEPAANAGQENPVSPLAAAQTGAVQTGHIPLPSEPDAADRARFRYALAFMSDSAVDLLGFKAYFITMKLGKCLTTNDLLLWLPTLSKAIAKRHGPEMAHALEERAHQMLQPPR